MTVAAIVLVAATTAMTARRNLVLERRLIAEIERVDGVSTLVEDAMAPVVTDADLARILSGLQATTDRVDALEAMSTASARVIASAADAVVFLQGSYQFFEPASGRPLRMMIGPDGQPIRNPFGHPALSLDGDGPPLEVSLTGTGFIATPEGLLLTNRHVAIPWEFDDAAAGIIRSGFEPRWRRFQAFLPGTPAAHPVDLVIASDEADLAVVQMLDVSGEVHHVDLSTEIPAAGDAVLVMGYPLGLRALMARTDAGFISGLQRDGVSDFFDQAERMAEAGFIQPLATRGIVGQVTGASVVYDAETTSGGSGGPVLSLDGSVVAVNTAILPEFGGSNLGVPAAAALALIRRARGD